MSIEFEAEKESAQDLELRNRHFAQLTQGRTFSFLVSEAGTEKWYVGVTVEQKDATTWIVDQSSLVVPSSEKKGPSWQKTHTLPAARCELARDSIIAIKLT